MIYAAQGALAQFIFRVSTMGAIAHADMERFVAVVKQMILERKPDTNL